MKGLFIEAETEAAHDARVGDAAGGVDDYGEDYNALVLGFAGFFGVLGFDLIEQGRRADAGAGTENAAADAALRTGSDTRTITRADTAIGAGADAGGLTRAVRGHE